MQRGQARFITYYRFLALRRHCSVGFRYVYTSRFREIPKDFIENIIEWRVFALFVERKPLILIPEGLPCVQLECREVHVSFTDSLTIRRIVLCPSVVNGIKIDEMFADCGSPALVQIQSSCVFKVR